MSFTVQALREQEEKRNRHKFKKGEIGNPNGRPKGSKNKVTLLKEAILQNAEEKVLQEFMGIVNTTIKLANEGDTTCLKILWDRIIPSKRAVDITHKGDDKLNVVINISGMETKGVKDVEIIDGEVTEIDVK